MRECDFKHAKPQIPDSAWKCPKCHVGPDTKRGDTGFIIDDGVNCDCELLHDEDLLICHECGYETTGKRFAAAYARKQNLVPCPHCKGTGMVKKRSSR